MEIFSEHFQKEHSFSKVDARVKLIVVLALLMMVISSKGILFPLFIAAGCFLVCRIMKAPTRIILTRIAEPLFLAGMVLLLKLLFTGNETMFSFNVMGLELTGHRDGLIDGIRIASRIIGGVSLVVTLGFATPFTEIMAGLSWLRIPKQFIEIMMFAYRYIFVFLEEGLTIYNAQKNRLGYAGIRKGMKSFGVLAGSLVIRGFDQSQKTSEAMIQRGYTGDMPLLKNYPLRFGELAIAVVFIIFAGVVWMI
ncbi:MAG: cobalt ECF transporter T component CbiQ [Nitrospirae bacterium]|nr:cobalt ECF transporter T component CbiQ [Nitrospirota bacterium]